MMKNADTKQKQAHPGSKWEANWLDLREEIQKQYGAKTISWFSWVFDALELPPESRILDIGGGTGSLWSENAPRIPESWKIVLADIEPQMLRSAQARLLASGARQNRPGLFFSDGQALPYADESFDAVIAGGVLDLVPDVQTTLKEVERTLRPGGLFVATAGSKGHLRELESLVRPYLPTGQAENIGGVEKRFGMENGAELLSPFFQDITRRDYHDRMTISTPQPVLDYIFSERVVTEFLTLDRIPDFVASIKRRLAKNGQISVTIRKGLFTARKRSS